MRRIMLWLALCSLLSSAVSPVAARSIPDHDQSPVTIDAAPDCVTIESGARPIDLATVPQRPSAVYTFSGTTIVTPTIDGVFTGLFVDGDGVTSPGAGVQDPLAFIVQTQFDADDNVYWFDPASTYIAWSPLSMSLWRDGNDNGTYEAAFDSVIAGIVPTDGTLGVELNGLSLFPGGPSALGFSPLVFNDAEFMYAPLSLTNNRYDPGEDIFYVGQYQTPPKVVDSVNEFRGADQLLVPDPDNPNGPAIAHIYIEQDANYLYFHNDFLVDADAPFYDFDGLTANNGFIDGDGVTTAGAGTPDRVGVDPAARRWFTTTDQIDWYDADNDAHWTPSLDALWADNGDDVYNAGLDGLIVYSGGTLTENLTSTVRLNPATFEFVYSDDNGTQVWDSGEDIWGLSGNEIWDFNYFDNRLVWLIDGDGATTTGRGLDNARVDGDQWFDADDRVFWYDANADEEWTEATDALWRDANNNGTYQSGTDTLIRADVAVPQNSATNMILLQRLFVDGNGTGAGAGSDDTSRTGQAAFTYDDHVFWHDGDRSQDWTISDTMWLDDGDGIYGSSITDTLIVAAAGFTSGTIGTALTPAAHWIGYDDGEVAFNGRYDSGEDISASNSYFAYDDFEIAPNFKYDLSEDIYDRDYLEIWVYAEGNNADARMGGNEPAPDRETALRDIGFRVHLNGVRLDAPAPITTTRVISDYDAPHGIQAAAGWGVSRGFVGPVVFGPPDPAFGGFNRHYEYRLPRRDGLALRAALRPFKESEHSEIIAILPDCSVLIEMTWKDVRRNSQGKFVSGSGAEYPSSSGSQLVWETWDFLHPPPLPPIPWFVKADLNDPLLPLQQLVPSLPGQGGPPPLPQSFFDVFYYNDLNQPITQLTLRGNSSVPGQLQLLSAQASSAETIIQPGSGATFAQVMNLAPGDWVGLVVQNQLLPSTLPPGSPITNSVEVTGTTPGGPLPPSPPAGDSSTFNPPITIELTKTSMPITTVVAGGLITYSVLYENLSQFPLSNVRLTDTLPISVSPLRGFPLDSFFDVFYTIDLPRPLARQERGRFEVTAIVSSSLQAGVRLTNTVRSTFTAPPDVTGTKTITQSVIVSTTPGLIIPPNVITVTGPITGEIDTPYFFTATVGPIDTTLPITWVTRAGLQPPITDITNVPIELVELSLTSSGPIPITVTASNAGGTVTGTHTITISPFISITSVTIDGPSNVKLNTPTIFTATVSPISATLPITYVWLATDLPPITRTGGIIDAPSFAWTLPGAKTLTVTASNRYSLRIHEIFVEVKPEYRLYLPIVLRNAL